MGRDKSVNLRSMVVRRWGGSVDELNTNETLCPTVAPLDPTSATRCLLNWDRFETPGFLDALALAPLELLGGVCRAAPALDRPYRTRTAR